MTILVSLDLIECLCKKPQADRYLNKRAYCDLCNHLQESKKPQNQKRLTSADFETF